MRDLATESTHTNGLVCAWVPVQDADGRVRMEARWYVERDAVTHPAA